MASCGVWVSTQRCVFSVLDNPPRSKFEDGIDAKNSASGLYKVVPNKVSSSLTTLLLHYVLLQYLSVASHFASVSHQPLSLFCPSISMTTLTLPQYLTDHSHFASVSQWPLSLCLSISFTTLTLPQYLTDHSHFAPVSHWPLSLCLSISVTTLTLPQYLTNHSHFA